MSWLEIRNTRHVAHLQLGFPHAQQLPQVMVVDGQMEFEATAKHIEARILLLSTGDKGKAKHEPGAARAARHRMLGHTGASSADKAM